MSDPNIIQYTRPIYESEVEEYGQINLDEHRFNLGILFLTEEEEENVPLSIPEGVGRMTSSLLQHGPDPVEYVLSDLVNCTNLFQDRNMELSENALAGMKDGYCMDPKVASVKGVSTYGFP